MKHRGEAHEFALYVADLLHNNTRQDTLLNAQNEEMVHRISRVLRLNVGDSLLIFNENVHAESIIVTITKHSVVLRIKHIELNELLKPSITLLLPLLKKEALEQAIYSATEMGVQIIQLIHTQKVQRVWHEKDIERLEHIIIAAAEQSKCFSLPQIFPPISLTEVSLQDTVLFFDPQGQDLLGTLSLLKKRQLSSYTLIIGPEGDLTESEKFNLQQQNVVFVRLTPTILRAQQAVALAVGIIRSFF